MKPPTTTKRPSQVNGSRPSPLKINKHAPPSNPPRAAAYRRPVIIYTHSPEPIHTKPRDFMALVQSLTGMARPGADPAESDASSVLSGGGGEARSASPIANFVVDSVFGDVPLFTPNSSGDFFCSPPRVYRFSGGSYSPASSLSPSAVEFMKILPDY